MIGFDLSAEQQLLQKTARDFALGRMRPLVERVHREGIIGDPWAIAAPVVAEGAALGFTKMLVPEVHGGLGLSCVDACLILEEIGAVDVGMASDYFSLTATMPLMMLRAGTAAQISSFVGNFVSAPTMILAGAQSEPNVAGSELMMAGPDPAFGPKLAARRGDEGWVLSGEKSAFVTNAGIADHYFILARTDPAKPVMGGLSVFHVPADTSGLTIGKKTPLIGWPLTRHAALHFDDVRLPASALVGDEGGAAMIFAGLPEMPVCLAACFVGLARASLDYAIDYAKQRKSTGLPIAQHQVVALKIAEMARELHAARLMVWEAAWACAVDPMRAAMFSGPAAKAKAVDVAIRNAQLCLEVLGGYGVTREYEAGRLLNDAMIGYSCDFTREILHLGIAAGLCGDHP
jgi:alkylation response protein AidB-like acyl-CoA dehydrogenase